MIPDFPHNIRIRLARLKFFFCCILTQHFFLIRPILSYIMRKVWYHQIWIQNYLGIIVSDLIDILRLRQLQNISTPDFWTTNFHPDTKWILYSLVRLVEMLYIYQNKFSSTYNHFDSQKLLHWVDNERSGEQQRPLINFQS